MKAEAMKVQKHGGRNATLMIVDNRPAQAVLVLRESQPRSACGRVKAMLVVPMDDGTALPLPFAQAGSKATCEFVMEMS